MKKKLASLLIVTAMAIATVLGGTLTAQAGTFREECDAVFGNALKDVAAAEGLETDAFGITREPLYDVALNQLGYFYLIDAKVSEGYALAIYNDGVFDVTEIYLDAENPFKEYDGKKVYVNLFMYLIYEDGEYIEVATGEKLSGEALEETLEIALYNDEGTSDMKSSTVYYTERSEINYELAKRLPHFVGLGTKSSCVPTAGGNIIYYYDRFCPNLIPDFEPGVIFAEYYLYNPGSSEIYPIMETLYDYMGTDNGTSVNGFKQGMNRYVQEKGYAISYNSCILLKRFLYNTAKSNLDKSYPLILFLDVYNVTTTQTYEDHDFLQSYVSTTPHAMVAFGYREITYTTQAGVLRVDKYLKVASGIAGHDEGYFNVLYNATIDDCYGVVIS